MQTTFVTNGYVEPIYEDDDWDTGNIIGYNVGRKDTCTIRLSKDIDEYYTEGNRIYIDPWGSPWVKK